MTPPGLPAELLSRVEDAGLNASAPPQQRWLDGWLVRFSPGKAQRARCINAVAAGRLPLDDKLAACAALYQQAGLPMLFRLTPFSQPPALDQHLDERGFQRIEDTRVMVCPALPVAAGGPQPAGLQAEAVDTEAYAPLMLTLLIALYSQRLSFADSAPTCSPQCPRRCADCWCCFGAFARRIPT